MALPRFNVKNAASYEEASELLRKDEHTVAIGGGTDLLHGLKDYIYGDAPELVVNLKSIPEADGIKETADGLHIGALTTIHELETNKLLQDKYTAFAQAAASVASPQIRNIATLAGNICQEPRCWYYRNANDGFHCLRKGGEYCNALTAHNDLHSVFGAMRVKDTPCKSYCPSGINISEYMSAIRENNWKAAAEKLLEDNPFPAVTGRVCPHFCEAGCNRKLVDDSVSIRCVERMLGDYILEHATETMYAPAQSSGKKVAVVGAGPAGLSAAYYLRKQGHDVTVIDRNACIGGMLTYAIPAYRLPKTIIAQIEKAMHHMGIRFLLNTSVGNELSSSDLSEQYDAVFFGCGAGAERNSGILGDELLTSGLELLRTVANGKELSTIHSAAVLGGGNTAIDVACTLRRMGVNVKVLYRRTEAEMPAIHEDIEQAKQEGVEFAYLTQPISVAKKDMLELTCLRTELSELDDSGRRKAVPIKGSEYAQCFDAVYTAFGEVPDRTVLSSGNLTKDGKFQRSGNVFAGGDFVTGGSTVTQAMAGGKAAAKEIAEFFGDVESATEEKNSLLSFDCSCVMTSQAAKSQDLSLRTLFDEDFAGIDKAQSVQEAKRCMNCGCVAASPSDLAPVLVAFNADIRTTKRLIPAKDFFAVGVQSSTILHRGELVTEIVLPKQAENTRSVYYKYRQRKAIDFPLVSLAARVTMQGDKISDISLVLGAVAPIPVHAEQAESFVIGKTVTDEVISEAAHLALSRTTPLPHNTYKLAVIKAFIRKALDECGK